MSNTNSMPKISDRATWLDARRTLLTQEKTLMKQYDDVARARRDLPRVKVDATYTFDTPDGKKSLGDLFQGRSQLVVYHFMFGPDWEVGCKSCSFWADHFDAMRPHLAARDIELVAVSHAPLAKFTPFKKRMGWTFPWLSAHGSTFNQDYAVSFSEAQVESKDKVYNFGTQSAPATESPGISTFIREDDGTIFHTYSTFSRGLDMVNGTYRFMDVAPRGRDESELPWSMAWIRFHDEYDQ